MRSIRGRRERAARALAWGAGCAAALAAGAPLGCGRSLAAPIPSEHGGAGPPRRGGTLHLASIGDLRNLDPAGPSDGLALRAEELLFAGLVDYDDAGRVVPDLAERLDVEDGGRTYRFSIRVGVRMHDGQELTADDVKRSVERALNPATPDPNASYFRSLAGYDDYLSGRSAHLVGVVVEGRYVVSFHLSEPDATFLPVLAMPTLRPVCRTAGDRYDDAWTPCGAGPFRLPPGGWQRGLSLRLVRHDGYFRAGLPYLEAVEWSFGVPPSTQRLRFEQGSLDVLRDLGRADLARFTADPRWRPLGAAEADRDVYGEAMNTRMAPFDEVEIRRAVAAALDRDHYRALKPAAMTPLTQLVPPGVPGYDPAARGQRHDLAAALEHMRRAGYAYDPVSGIGGWPSPIVYPVFDKGLALSTAQILQQDLAKIGLRIELRLVSWPTFLALQSRPGGAAMSQGNWEADYLDPSALFEPLFSTASIGPEESYNASFYSNPRFDDLVSRARRETDAERRRALYRQADELLCDEAPWAFAYAHHAYEVRQPYVQGLRPAAPSPMNVSHVWIDRTAEALGRMLGLGGVARAALAMGR